MTDSCCNSAECLQLGVANETWWNDAPTNGKIKSLIKFMLISLFAWNDWYIREPCDPNIHQKNPYGYSIKKVSRGWPHLKKSASGWSKKIAFKKNCDSAGGWSKKFCDSADGWYCQTPPPQMIVYGSIWWTFCGWSENFCNSVGGWSGKNCDSLGGW